MRHALTSSTLLADPPIKRNHRCILHQKSCEQITFGRHAQIFLRLQLVPHREHNQWPCSGSPLSATQCTVCSKRTQFIALTAKAFAAGPHVSVTNVLQHFTNVHPVWLSGRTHKTKLIVDFRNRNSA